MSAAHRITIATGQLDVGGQERSLYLLVRSLDRRRFDIDVVSLTAGGYWAEEIRRLGVSVLELPRRHRWQAGRLLRLCRHLRARRSSLVYSLGFAANTYGRIAGRLAGVPHLVTGWRGLEASPLRFVMELLLARSTDRVVCNSAAVLQDVLSHYPIPRERAALIRNGVEVLSALDPDERAHARRELGAGADEVLVGSVARLAEDKNPILFLRVAALVRSTRPDIRFVLVGGGPLRSILDQRITALGQDGGVRLMGERPDGRLLAASFDIFILTSHREGMPNAVLEAMAAGVPCVATAVGGCREVIVDGQTGYLAPAGDERAMAARILDLAGSSALRERLGGEGRKRALVEFSPERMAREHEALFQELLG